MTGLDPRERVIKAGNELLDREWFQTDMVATRVPADAEWLTIDQARAERQLSERTIRRAIASGALVASKYGRVYRILRSDLDAWDDSLATAPRARGAGA